MRVSGVVLQLLGLSVVGSQLFRAQQAFRMDKQSVLEAGWAAVKKWAHSRPHWRDDVRLRVQNAHMAITGSADMQLDAFVYPAAGAGAEAWILALKRRLEEVVQRVDKLSLAHASALQELKDELRHEGDKRAADFEEILRRVDDSVFGGLAWQLIGGVFWVGVGVVLSAFPCVAGRLFGATCGASG
jgi:hypothetical protein